MLHAVGSLPYDEAVALYQLPGVGHHLLGRYRWSGCKLLGLLLSRGQNPYVSPPYINNQHVQVAASETPRFRESLKMSFPRTINPGL